MKSKNASGWGAVLALAVTALGCSGKVGIGEDFAHAGAGGGAQVGSAGDKGESGAPDENVGGTAGFAGAMPEVGGIGGEAGATPGLTCPAPIDFDDGALNGLAYGPNNHALSGLTNSTDLVKSYADDTIYDTRTLKAVAEFPTKTEKSPPVPSPDDGIALAPLLAELSLTPVRCKTTDLTGQTVTVHFFVPLTGAVPGIPSNGAFLGSYRGSTMTYYSDATLTKVISTLTERTLTHTFTAAEAAEVTQSGLFLRLYASDEIAVRLYVDRIDWS
jgi:hypothetical protein